MAMDVDFKVRNIVVGADIDAVRFAHDNKFFLIKNRAPYHHSYEGIEEEWAAKTYELFELGLVPFRDRVNSLRIIQEKKMIKINSTGSVYTVEYEKLHLFDYENVSGVENKKEIVTYRVIDWFDCKGLGVLNLEEIKTEDKFVNNIKFFPSCRVDGARKCLDLFCESFLSREQLSDFEFSDTMARFKVLDVLKKHDVDKAELTLWKRDTYPVFERGE